MPSAAVGGGGFPHSEPQTAMAGAGRTGMEAGGGSGVGETGDLFDGPRMLAQGGDGGASDGTPLRPNQSMQEAQADVPGFTRTGDSGDPLHSGDKGGMIDREAIPEIEQNSYTPQQIEKFARENGINSLNMSFDEIYQFCGGKQELAESLLKALPEAHEDVSLNLDQRVKKYNLSEHPEKQSLSAYQTRVWYIWQESLIESRLDRNQSIEQVARQAFEMRNSIRTQARESMKDAAWSNHLFSTQKNVTFEMLVEKYSRLGFSGNDLWNEIIKASMRSRSSIDTLFGLNNNI